MERPELNNLIFAETFRTFGGISTEKNKKFNLFGVILSLRPENTLVCSKHLLIENQGSVEPAFRWKKLRTKPPSSRFPAFSPASGLRKALTDDFHSLITCGRTCAQNHRPLTEYDFWFGKFLLQERTLQIETFLLFFTSCQLASKFVFAWFECSMSTLNWTGPLKGFSGQCSTFAALLLYHALTSDLVSHEKVFCTAYL